MDFFIPYMESEVVDVVRLYRKRSYLITIIKYLFLKVELYAPFWYGDWRRKTKSYSEIIIFATKDYSFIKKIKKDNPSIKITFWYWNPAFRMGIPRKVLFNLARVFSFDQDDCEKYNLSFNTTFYFEKIKLKKKKDKYDTLFVGLNKGRRETLEKLYTDLNSLELKNLFHIVPDKDENHSQKKKPIPYKEYLELLAESKCIIDIIAEGQSGLTVRSMESIFHQKKLITNDLNIKNQDFYDPNNIYIIGIDKFEDIADFINSPYEKVNPIIVEKYDFKNWLKRFNL